MPMSSMMQRLAVGLVLLMPALAQDAVSFALHCIDGRSASGALTIGTDGAVRLTPAQGDAIAVTLADVLSIEAVDPAPDAVRAPMYAWLRSGTRFPATAIDGAAAGAGKPAVVRFTIPSGATMDVPLSMVAALRCREVEPKTFAQDREAPELNQDFLFVVKEGKPQRFSVAVESIHDGKLHFELGGESYDFALTGDDSTAAVVFGKNTGFAPDRQGKPRISMTLAGGEVLDGRLLEFGANVRLKIDEGAEVSVAAAKVRRLDVVSEKLTWLSKLTPKAEQTPAFDRVWPWTLDRSPMGPGIQLGGKTYARGLVLVPKTRLTFELGGKYDVFEATIGIDERGGPQAHAIFRVLVDGKVAFDSGPIQRDTQAKPVRVELAKCQSLAIEADFGKNFDLGDLCAFADARLVQK